MGLGNLRSIGSGNIGATNVLRTGNKLAAILTLFCDLLKVAIVLLFARVIFDETAAQIAGLGSSWDIASQYGLNLKVEKV